LAAVRVAERLRLAMSSCDVAVLDGVGIVGFIQYGEMMRTFGNSMWTRAHPVRRNHLTPGGLLEPRWVTGQMMLLEAFDLARIGGEISSLYSEYMTSNFPCQSSLQT
jgi:hypothetical protein